MKKWKNLSVLLKISLIFELAFVTTVTLVVAGAFSFFSSVISEKEIALGDTKLEKLAVYIEEKYNRVYSLNNYMHSSNITKIMSDIAADATQAYNYEYIKYCNVFFSGISSADPDISDVILISVNGPVYSMTSGLYSDMKPSYDFMQSERIRGFFSSAESQHIFYDNPSDYCLKKRSDVISFMGKIYDASLYPQKKVVGFYMINIPVSVINDAMMPAEGGLKGEISLVNKQDQIIFCTDARLNGTDYQNVRQTQESYWKEKLIGNSGLRIEYTLSKHQLYYEINRLRDRIWAVSFAAVLITTLLCYSIYKTYNRRIRRLLGFLMQVEEGKFDITVPVDSKDEIGVISNAFNEMCQKLTDYIARVYQAELQRKDAELNALQMQINPHFLYNTLESIKAQAVKENDKITPEMVTLLGNLFRWSSNTRNRFVILEEEIDYVKTYLKLQSYRYDRNMEIDIKIDEENLDYAVPKLILQPMVENIIKHALMGVERSWLVGISAKKKTEKLEITIYDNGCGMPKEKLKELQEGLDKDLNQNEFQSIGIQNVNHRIKLLFGSEYGVWIESIEKQGTAVKVIIPALYIEEMNACITC